MSEPIYRIMTDQKFEKELQHLRARVKRMREEGRDNNAVRCYLIGWVTTGEIIRTPAQLEKIFDLGFEEGKSDETQTA